MRQGKWGNAPAVVISVLALFVALGGTVYAAARIDGRAIKPRSLPGNRLIPRSTPGNRLRPKSIPGNRLRPRSIGAGRLRPALLQRLLQGATLAGPLTGADINELTLGQVPSAARAETAASADSAKEAETALNAVNAIAAQTVNGHSAGCLPGTAPFAGACWQASPSISPSTAPDAAESCALQGGALPEALQLAAFAKQPGVNLHAEDEWSGDIVSFTAEDAYSVATVSEVGAIGSGLFNGAGGKVTRHYRCVIPLVR